MTATPDETRNWHVRVEGRVTEHYVVQASSADDAMERWADGELLHSEAWDCEPVSAEEDQ